MPSTRFHFERLFVVKNSGRFVSGKSKRIVEQTTENVRIQLIGKLLQSARYDRRDKLGSLLNVEKCHEMKESFAGGARDE